MLTILGRTARLRVRLLSCMSPKPRRKARCTWNALIDSIRKEADLATPEKSSRAGRAVVRR